MSNYSPLVALDENATTTMREQLNSITFYFSRPKIKTTHYTHFLEQFLWIFMYLYNIKLRTTESKSNSYNTGLTIYANIQPNILFA